MEWERPSRFSIENLLFHRTQTFRRGAPMCFKKFLLSGKCMDKTGCKGDRVSRFPWKNFFLTVAKKFIERPFSVKEI